MNVPFWIPGNISAKNIIITKIAISEQIARAICAPGTFFRKAMNETINPINEAGPNIQDPAVMIHMSTDNVG